MMEYYVAAIAGTFFGIWVTWWAYDNLILYLKRRRARKSLEAGEVPVDYEEVGRMVQQMNSSVVEEAMGDTKVRKRLGDLKRVRYSVARIRDNGYVVGERRRHAKDPIEPGLAENPHPKGTGESKQWVRGFCMGFCERDPGKWMRKA